MVRINIEHENEAEVVQLDGKLTVEHGRKIREALVKTLEADRNVVLRFGDVTDADLSLVQLLLAASRSASRSGVALILGDPVPTIIKHLVAVSGFADNECFAGLNTA